MKTCELVHSLELYYNVDVFLTTHGHKTTSIMS